MIRDNLSDSTIASRAALLQPYTPFTARSDVSRRGDDLQQRGVMLEKGDLAALDRAETLGDRWAHKGDAVAGRAGWGWGRGKAGQDVGEKGREKEGYD